MPILLACGDEGLLEYHDRWERIACPLACPSLLARSGSRLMVLDDRDHLMWNGERLFAVPAGVEAIACWQENCLVLSGDTDCITLLEADTGMPLVLVPAGVYPQELCLLPGRDAVAVCGGVDGSVRLLSLPELRPQGVFHVPGNAQRVACQGGWLCVLCAVEDDGLCCLAGRIPLYGGRYDPLLTMRGLPGAVRGDGRGGWWIAASECLCHLDAKGQVDRRLLGQGLIRHMDAAGQRLLVSDPVLGACTLVDAVGRQPAQILYEGDVRHALWL